MLSALNRTSQLARRTRLSTSAVSRSLSYSPSVQQPRRTNSISAARTNPSSPRDDEGGEEGSGANASSRYNQFFNPSINRRPSPAGSSGGPLGPSEDGEAGGEPSHQPDLPSGFASTYLSQPTPRPSSQSHVIPYYVDALRNQLLTSFLPTNQFDKSHDPTIAIVSPLEGTEYLIREAIESAAGTIGADVVRLETMECLGMKSDGPLGMAGDCLKLKENPLLVAESDLPQAAATAEESAEDLFDEEEGGEEEGHVFQIGQPFEIAIPFPGQGGRKAAFPPGMAMMMQQQGKANAERHKIDKLFYDIVNVNAAADAAKGEDVVPENEAEHDDQKSSTPTSKPRIIYVQDATAMSSTFPQWYPSLLSAVRQRRKTDGPTTIVLGCSPSLLHTGPNLSKQKQENAEAPPSGPPGMPPNLAKLLGSLSRGGPGTQSTDKSRTDQLWMSSAEEDVLGRKRRFERRLRRFKPSNDRDLRSLLPAFGDTSDSASSGPSAPPGMIDITQIIGQMNHGNKSLSTSSHADKEAVKIWKVVGVLPKERKTSSELHERQHVRLKLNTLLLKRAIAAYGGHLTSQLPAEELNDHEETGIEPILQEITNIRNSFANSIWPWAPLQHLASISVGHSLAVDRKDDPNVTWESIAAASLAEEKAEARTELWTDQHLASHQADIKPKSRQSKGEEPQKDPVVEAIRNDKRLPPYEKRLLGCIVDKNKLQATSFNDVHLPEKTIDGIRSMVTLPLLYPEAFNSGILAQHTTTGALLFGPPGTGKSHLIRALARESGARMLAIQPSDVNDMYVGEGEKLVKAVFTLARKLAPCIVFLDEVDSLFGARSGQSAGGAQAHRQILTEFMQEMDGLTSASANKNQVIVIGATNRPYDLDEAVLRRLPRRMLVDLPGKKDREAILKILLRKETVGSDVDLSKIADRTDTYSGSDLKHLCVHAALAAIKESVKLPWKDTTSEALPASASSIDTLSGAGPSTTTLLTQDHEHSELLHEPREPITQMKRETPNQSIDGSEENQVVDEDQQIPPSVFDLTEGEYPKALDKETTASKIADADERTDDLITNAQDALDRYVPVENLDDVHLGEEDIGITTETEALEPRVLHMRHFEIAMKEITPSSSESGNLPELRKWNSQYGEGGTQRGKKSGYGAKFGFGDAGGGKDDPAFGRVKPEESES